MEFQDRSGGMTSAAETEDDDPYGLQQNQQQRIPEYGKSVCKVCG